MKKDFDDIVGMKYLVALHLNDSKGKFINVSLELVCTM